MHDRVIDQRQQHHRRHAGIARGLGNVDVERKPVAEPKLHDVEVGTRQLDLLRDGRRRIAHARHRGAQVGDQFV